MERRGFTKGNWFGLDLCFGGVSLKISQVFTLHVEVTRTLSPASKVEPSHDHETRGEQAQIYYYGKVNGVKRQRLNRRNNLGNNDIVDLVSICISQLLSFPSTISTSSLVVIFSVVVANLSTSWSCRMLVTPQSFSS
jgi:hypothetical protein